MNRIREIRETNAWSQEELARRVGTSQTQIDRLEKGERKLTVQWMQRIAQAFDIAPQELLSTALLAGFQNEAEPYQPTDPNVSAARLAQHGLSYYRITGRSVEKRIPPDSIRPVDTSITDPSDVRTGDIIVAEVMDQNREKVLIVRVFSRPDVLHTVRHNYNLAVDLANIGEFRLIGVVRGEHDN